MPLPPVVRPNRLYTLRQAARDLGLSRGRTLQPAVDAGLVRVVDVAGEPRIPASEVSRIAREGLPAVATPTGIDFDALTPDGQEALLRRVFTREGLPRAATPTPRF